MSIQAIHDALRAAGMTEAGACGLMGNMRAESGMRSDNAQDSHHVDDATYTAQADMGVYETMEAFYHDGVGYGLCQWTEASRKAKLLAYAKMQGASVGDEDMQVRFCVWELMNDFPQVWAVLTSSEDLRRCTEIVLDIYERPAAKNLDARLAYAEAYFQEFAGQDAAEPYPWKPDLAVMTLQTLMYHDGYWDGSIDGYKSEEFRTAVVQYAQAVAEC